MSAYYNENDPFAVAWLRELIKHKHIADGVVDERNIKDVAPSDLRGFVQHHFFAGIGTWSFALRLAQWSDDEPVWTGSCPCQPFSLAGKRTGTSDERHLWPYWFRLISECRPRTIFGEQVENAIKHGWLDLVSDELEGIGYSVAPVCFPACSIGAPHLRQRLYWLAHNDTQGRQGRLSGRPDTQREDQYRYLGCGSATGRLAYNNIEGCGIEQTGQLHDHGTSGHNTDGCGTVGRLAHSAGGRCEQRNENQRRVQFPDAQGSLGGFWSNCEWVWCRDEKWRPVEPGVEPLAHGAAKRVGRLRCYGNAIVAQQAEAFIRAFMEVRKEQWPNQSPDRTRSFILV